MCLSGKQIHVVFTASSLLNKQLRPNKACDDDIGVRGRLNQYPVYRYSTRFVVQGHPTAIFGKISVRKTIFGAFVVKFLACLLLLGFSNIYKMV